MATLRLLGVDTTSGQQTQTSISDTATSLGNVQLGTGSETITLTPGSASAQATLSAPTDATTVGWRTSANGSTATYTATHYRQVRTDATAAAGFGLTDTTSLELASGALLTATRISHTWQDATGGARIDFRVSRPGIGADGAGRDLLSLYNTGGVGLDSVQFRANVIAATDNTYDLGASGATRPRTAYLGTALNVGNGITPSTANGDIVAGDGTQSFVWDASAATQTINRTTDGLALITVESDTDSTTSRAFVQVCVDGDTAQGWGSVGAYSTGFTPTLWEIPGSVRFGATANMTGGMTLDVTAAAPIRFGTTNALRWQIEAGGDFVGGEEAGSATIRGADATTAATAGASLTLSGGDATTSGAGGVLNLTGGTSPSGTPGVVQVNSLPLPTVLSQTASIDLTSTGTTSLYTVPTGRTAKIISVIVTPTTATAAAGDTVASVGTNASTFDDIIPAQTLTGLDAITESFTLTVGGISHISAAAEVITFQVDTADTGTALTATVEVIGYLI